MKKYLRRMFLISAVLVLCLANQQIGSAPGERQLIFPLVAMTAVGVMTLAHYPLKSFCKPMYVIWLAAGAVLGTLTVIFGRQYTYYQGRLCWLVILGIVYGLLLLRTLYALIREKKRPSMHKWELLLYGAFLITALISAYDNGIAKIYLCCFGIVYLTDFSEKEKAETADAVLDGIIIGFFLIQGLAFVFRPYDILRYLGMYSNTNMNALMYQTAYCAFLGRFCLLEKKGAGLPVLGKLWKWICFVMAACMWGFVFLTMCRSAMLAMGIVTAVAWIWRWKERGYRKFLKLAGNAVVYAVLIVVSLPVVYAAVRYIPPVFHHPLYFYEGYSEERIISLDDWDSPKYIDWDQVVEGNLGRILDVLKISERENREETVPDKVLLLSDTWGRNTAISAGRSVILSAANAPLQQANTSSGSRSVFVRGEIYRHYLSEMNLLGHKEAENGIQISERYFAPHAHNLFLQYAFNYGVIAGIFFAAFIAVCLILLWKDQLPLLLLYISVMVFGLTEIVWTGGTMTWVLMFLIPVF